MPFFLVSFFDPDTRASLSACPRSLLKRAVDKLAENGLGAMAGGELPYRDDGLSRRTALGDGRCDCDASS